MGVIKKRHFDIGVDLFLNLFNITTGFFSLRIKNQVLAKMNVAQRSIEMKEFRVSKIIEWMLTDTSIYNADKTGNKISRECYCMSMIEMLNNTRKNVICHPFSRCVLSL